jgi:hypothetical protein
MELKEITPRHLRCGIAQCPAVYEYGARDLIIIGKIVDGDVLAQIAGKIGSDEYAVRISREMFADLDAGNGHQPAAG